MVEPFSHATVLVRFEANPTDHVANTRDLRAALARIAELELERLRTRQLLKEIALTIVRGGVPSARNWGELLANLRHYFKHHAPPPGKHVVITVPTAVVVEPGS